MTISLLPAVTGASNNCFPIDSDLIDYVLVELSQDEEALSQEFTNLPPGQIAAHVQNNIIEVRPPENLLEGVELFSPVLKELDKLKDKLGGSPSFGLRTPCIDELDNHRLFFGISVAHIKDWFRMVLKKEWRPAIFWESLAKLFNVTKDGQRSQYEEAYISIQRFGLLISNKERFFQILNSQQSNRYIELNTLTGLGWHPNSNGSGSEKMYIEFIEQFLTIYFEDAKQKGEDVLIEYFNAFSGLCLEDRARALEEYALSHPLILSGEEGMPSDWDTGGPVEIAYMKEVQVLAERLKTAPTSDQLLEHLRNRGVFDLEFSKSNGEKTKPSQEDFFKWAKEQVEACILSE